MELCKSLKMMSLELSPLSSPWSSPWSSPESRFILSQKGDKDDAGHMMRTIQVLWRVLFALSTAVLPGVTIDSGSTEFLQATPPCARVHAHPTN